MTKTVIHNYLRPRSFPFASIIPCIVAAILLVAIDQVYAGTGDSSVTIPEKTIAKLIGEVSEVDPKLSASRLRRAYKGIIRVAEDLVKDQPTATNRYRVYHILLKLQRRLLSLDRSERTRSDLFETCRLLSEAPDRYAEFRLDADMLLSDRDLTIKEATFKERAVELRRLVQLYRDTPAELKCLMIAMKLADQLDDIGGKGYYFKMIWQRFAENPKAIFFIRKHIGLQRMDIIFAGKFERSDGVSLHFPYDRMGHAIIALFWSTKEGDYEKFLSQVKVQQEAQPGRFEIYSFCLDELDDAGASILKGIGLKCSVMKLPGGKNSETYRTYALKSPQALLVNEYGRTITEPEQLDKELEGHTGKQKESPPFTYPKLIPSHIRYQMQLQSLFNGDFFVQDDKSALAEEYSLPAAPFRYRLSPATAYSHYSKIEELSASAIETQPDSPELWRVRNYRIIALMGMWSHTGEQVHLQKAVAESRALLSQNMPANASMVAQYCLARYALRTNIQTKKEIITKFVEDLGGDKASDMVIAAASVLAVNANAVDLHEHYRDLFLKSKKENPYSVVSFLRNRHHRYYLFQGDISYLHLDRRYKHRERRYIINNDISVPTPPLPPVSLKKLDGSEMHLPNPNKDGGTMTVLMFLEPPSDGTLNLDPCICSLPEKVDPEKKKARNGRPLKPSGIIHMVSQLAEAHINKDVRVVLAFLSDDADQIKALHKKYNFPCEVALVPSGLKNPIVRSLDLFSADRLPNIFFIRRNGTIPWYSNGFPYRVEPDLLERHSYLALRTHIYRADVETGYQALFDKDYGRAKELFYGPYISETRLDMIDNWRQSNGRTENHKWTTSQYYGRALAHIGLGEWDDALKYIERAEIDHMVYFRHDEDRPCSTGIGLHKAHALIFDNLGRKSEARKLRSKALLEPTDYPTDYFKFTGYDKPYEQFNEKLNQLQLNQKK